MPRVLVPLANGCEELEAITIMDLLDRAGAEVVSAAVDGSPVRASHGTTLLPSATLDDVLGDDFDLVALPGGMPGAATLRDDDRVKKLLQRMAVNGKFVAAICAGPMALGAAGLLDGKRATGYPGSVDNMDIPGLNYTGAPIEQDGNIITSRGPGTAMDFALKLVEVLFDMKTRTRVGEALLRP